MTSFLSLSIDMFWFLLHSYSIPKFNCEKEKFDTHLYLSNKSVHIRKQCVYCMFDLFSTFTYSHQIQQITCVNSSTKASFVMQSHTVILSSIHHLWPPIRIWTYSSLATMEMVTLLWLDAGGQVETNWVLRMEGGGEAVSLCLWDCMCKCTCVSVSRETCYWKLQSQ